MHYNHFFDQTLAMIEQGQANAAVPMLVGTLYSSARSEHWPDIRQSLRQHPLQSLLMQDPYIERAFSKPRGYAGDAELIDYIYNLAVPQGTTARGQEIFSITTSFQAAQGVRLRRAYAEEFVHNAHKDGKRICALACGHLREADHLIGQDVSSITAVDQDGLSLAEVRRNHGETINMAEANVISFLRDAAAHGVQFDLIYTLGLTDYLDDRAMRLLHKLMKACLTPSGTITLANFVPHHLATGWMDAVMDWQLIYRNEEDLAGFAREIGMTPHTWCDASGSIAWCEMR